MKRVLSILVLIILTINLNAQFLKDVSFSELSEIDKNNSVTEEDFGFSEDAVPSSFLLLEEYCVVSNQKQSSSCTGFAIANGAMTILYNFVNGITRGNEKWVNRFDPFYVYCALKDPNDLECVAGNGCSCGSRISEGLELVENYGCKKLYLYPSLKCSSTLNKANLRSMVETTEAYSIDGFINIFKYEEVAGKWYKSVSIDKMKRYLSYNHPITAGINVNSDFTALSPENHKYSAQEGMIGRHAVTIIGYDDYKYGGAFRILNSYGYEWGDDGYFWMTYKDFEDQGDCAYVILKENWDDWINPISSDNFYKGKPKGSDSKTWEGPLDADRKFHGRGIITAEKYTAIGAFNHGDAHGWWLWFDNVEVADSWSGWVLFENGEYVESEDFGFSSSSFESVDVLNDEFHMDNMELELSDDPASEDNFTIETLESIKNSSSVSKKTNFNFNKTNNYNKK
tara:strand:+ start:25998 stop:27359 length:1362 start_codon:yes stop_codon:yes gene_type:complete